MFVIQVTPLIRGTKLESLSYFSAIQYEIGTFLKVPVRNKLQPAVVTKVTPATRDKSNVKSAAFKLKKLPAQKEAVVVPASVRATAEKLSQRYPAGSGALLYNLLPPDVRNGNRQYPNVITHPHQEETMPQLLTARIDDRFLYYQSHIRSVFARRGSTVFVVPTSADVAFAANELSTGIEERVVVLSPGDTKKKRDLAFKVLEETDTPKLIITTPAYAYLERADIQSIIIEQSASSHYTNRVRPYLDHRDALTTYAKVSGRSIILGDTVPRTEDEVRRRQDIYLTVGEEIKRLAFPAPLAVIHQKDLPQPEKNEPFKLFSPRLEKTAALTLEGGGRVFLYAARRGLSPVVACVDCGHIFRCPDSDAPYTLLRRMKNGEEERWFVSSTSGRRVKASDTCPDCGSWRLKERGIGIQQVADEWSEQFPDHKLFVVDSETAPTIAKARKIIDLFYSEKSAVLIGTQMVLPYLSRGVSLSALTSLDAVRATPTWKADESLFRLLLKLREITEKEVLLQTRASSDELLEHASRGAIEKFYDDEIALRQLLRYPPFVTFVLLTWTGDAEVALRAENIIKNTLSVEGEYYQSPQSRPSKQLRHCLLRADHTSIDSYKTLMAQLTSLPPFVKIEINPEKIV